MNAANLTPEETKKLGFGLMRLPKKGLGIDIPQTSEMVDLFLKAGFTYFDTAHVYPGSEEAARKALVERHPRESYTLATKLHAGIAVTEKAAKQQFETSLSRTGAEYIDYYLLHTLMENNYRKYEKYHLWDFAQEEKAKGRIKHVGFSFHDGPELLEQILQEHPEAEFVQLQINYADWENPSVTSRANYEVARKYGKSIVVMEPVKGGSLANPPKEVQELFKDYAPERSFASWAIRFVASLDGILTVLSGMSDTEQMKDNLSYMTDFTPLNEEERKIIRKAQEIMGRSATIPCTACSYCTKGCPKQIPIPDIFSAMNKRLGDGQIKEASETYRRLKENAPGAEACVACGQCERVCPQHIPIIEHLKKCAEVL
ncbi:MAG: aldo/keto reductase [Lachnospiraceae bacterium]|nr:aldo/keto reductase [Lachnospiraceae bacterium]